MRCDHQLLCATQPTRILYPTEIFRLQSSSIKNVSMNGDLRYTNANMNLPNYYDSFQGLTETTRSITYVGNASAKRKVIAADYGIVWQAMKNFSLEDQINFSNVHQPGTATHDERDDCWRRRRLRETRPSTTQAR